MLHFRRSGRGIPIVFLHAFPLSAAMWDVQTAEFSRHFDVLCPDFPGFGESPLVGHESLDAMADQVLASLKALKINQPVVLCGLSMGGYVAFRIMEKSPASVRALALVSTRSQPDSEETRKKRFENIRLVEEKGVNALAKKMIPTLLGATTQREKPSVPTLVEQLINSSQPAGVAAALKAMAERPDSSDVLPKITCPTLVISGQEDAVIPTAEMESMAARVAKHEFHAVPAAGHLLNLEQPDAFHELLSHFLKRRVL